MLDGGADIHQRNKNKSTALHLAVRNTGRGGAGNPQQLREQRKIIEILLARGARGGARDGKGVTVRAAAEQAWVRDALAG